MAEHEIAKILLKIGAVTIRPIRSFVWSSGIKSPIYCDNRLVLSHPESREQVIEGFLKKIKKEDLKFDVIAGIATAGIPYAAILADRLKKPMIYVRSAPKGHGKGNQIEGKFDKGDNVLVVEDLISTGQSSLGAVQALKKSGAKVSDCLAIFTYGFPFSKNAFQRERCRIHTLTSLESLIEVAVLKGILMSSDRKMILDFAKNPRA